MDYSVFENMPESPDMHDIFIRACQDSGKRENFNDWLCPVFVSCDEEKKEIVLQYEIQPWMANPYQIVHGGIITACADLSMGLLTRFLKRTGDCVTVQISTSYMRPIPAHGFFRVRAEAEKTGRHLYFMHAVICRSDSLPAASAEAEFM